MVPPERFEARREYDRRNADNIRRSNTGHPSLMDFNLLRFFVR